MITTGFTSVVNVSSVPQRSPFRYPGGKTWLVPRIRLWLKSLEPEPKELIEPFAGGAIVGLTAAFEELVERVTLVELDADVAAVWRTVLGEHADFLADFLWFIGADSGH
jgi:DNA adenine methylase